MSESSQGESPEVFEEFRERWQRSIEVGHLEEAEEIIQRALAWAREHGDPRRIDSVVCALAAVAIHLGRGDGELPRLREILVRNGDAGHCRLAAYNIAIYYEFARDYKKSLFYARIACGGCGPSRPSATRCCRGSISASLIPRPDATGTHGGRASRPARWPRKSATRRR